MIKYKGFRIFIKSDCIEEPIFGFELIHENLCVHSSHPFSTYKDAENAAKAAVDAHKTLLREFCAVMIGG